MSKSRNSYILQKINKTGFGLEIGPSYNPVTSKKNGWNVEVADHLDAIALREKYSNWGVDVSAIEDVDYVVGSKGLLAAIGKESTFDFIIASHVIEHVPDVVKFLVDCEKLLKFGGVLSLVVPDKRFCFDALKPHTTTGQILQAYFEKRERHSAGTIFDAHALHAKKGDAIVWSNNASVSDLTFVHTIQEAKNIMENYMLGNEYMDVHAWQFTPPSFEIIISDLIQLGYIGFEMAASFDTVGYEFFVSLRKSEKTNMKGFGNRANLSKRCV